MHYENEKMSTVYIDMGNFQIPTTYLISFIFFNEKKFSGTSNSRLDRVNNLKRITVKFLERLSPLCQTFTESI